MLVRNFLKKIWFWTSHIGSRHPRHYSPRRRRRTGAVVLLLLLTAIIVFGWYHLADRRMLAYAIEAIGRISGGEVELDEASLVVLRQIRIKGVRIYLPGREHIRANLVFAAQDVILQHRPWSIFGKRLQLNQIVADGVRLNIWYDLDKSIINLQLLSLGREVITPFQKPHIILRRGVIEYREIASGRIASVARQEIQGRVGPARSNPDIYEFELHSLETGVIGKSSVKGTYNQKTRQLATDGSFILELVDIASLPGRLAYWRNLYETIQPAGQLQITSTFEPSRGHNLRLSLENGRLNLPLSSSGYLLPLNSVIAKIACNKDEITIEKINGRLEDSCQLQLSGVIRGYSDNAPFDLEFQTQNLDIPVDQWQDLVIDEAALIDESATGKVVAGTETTLQTALNAVLKELPDAAQQFVDLYRPVGPIDYQLRIKRADGALQKPVCQGKIICHDGAFVYKHFPAFVSGVQGEIAFDPNSVIIGPLYSRQDNQEIEIEGKYHGEDEQSEFDLTVNAKNAPLNKNIYNALTPGLQRLWDRFSPTGTVNAFYKTGWRRGQQPEPNLGIELIDVNADWTAIGTRLTAMSGWVNWNQKLTAFEIKQGEVASGRFQLEGEINNLQRSDQEFQCQGQFRDVLLDEEFANNLPDKIGGLYRGLNLTGEIGGQIQLDLKAADHEPSETTQPSGQTEPTLVKPSYRIDFSLNDGQIRYEKFPYQLHNVQAGCVLTDRQLQIISLTGRNGRSQVELNGAVRGPNDFQLYLIAKPLELTDQLHQAMDDRKIDLWDKLDPSGQINLTMQLQRQPDRDLDYQATIEPLNSGFCLANFAYPFTNVTGKVIAEPNYVAIDRLHSTNERTQIDITGRLDRIGGARKYNLHIQADDLPLDDKLKHGLGGGLGGVCRRTGLTGDVDCDLEVNYHQEPNEKGIWQFNGGIGLKNGTCHSPLSTTNITGNLQGTATYDEGAQDFQLSAELARGDMQVLDRDLTEMTAKLGYDGKEKLLKVTDISSGFCQGRMAGHTQIDIDPNHWAYKVDLRFLEADLKELLNVAKEPNKKYLDLQGRCKGRFMLNKEISSLIPRGSLTFVVEEAVIGQLPIIAQLLHVINFKLPRHGAFNQAQISGDIVGDKLYFESIHLQGSAVSLTGTGLMSGPFFTADQDSDRRPSGLTGGILQKCPLELIFVVDPPDYLANIPILSSFCRAILPSLMQLRVSGTFDEPEVAPIAFPDLGDAFRQLEPTQDQLK